LISLTTPIRTAREPYLPDIAARSGTHSAQTRTT
jgi:hypothetical protein